MRGIEPLWLVNILSPLDNRTMIPKRLNMCVAYSWIHAITSAFYQKMTSAFYNNSLNKRNIVAKDRPLLRGWPSSTTTHSAPQERRWPCCECGQKPSSLAWTTLQSSWLVRNWGSLELHTEATALMVGANSRAGPGNTCRCNISAKICPPQEKPTMTMRVWTSRSRMIFMVSRVACTLQSTE